MKAYFASTLLAGALLCGASMNTSAAPFPRSTTVDAQAMTEKVHGYHRDCRAGHRNARGGIVECGPRYYYRDPSPGFSLYIGPRGGRDRDRDLRRDRDHRRDFRPGRRGDRD